MRANSFTFKKKRLINLMLVIFKPEYWPNSDRIVFKRVPALYI